MSWVRIVRDRGSVRCEVAGIGHRLPVVRVVPVRTAAALAARGVPLVFRTTVAATGRTAEAGA